MRFIFFCGEFDMTFAVMMAEKQCVLGIWVGEMMWKWKIGGVWRYVKRKKGAPLGGLKFLARARPISRTHVSPFTARPRPKPPGESPIRSTTHGSRPRNARMMRVRQVEQAEYARSVVDLPCQ